VQPALLALPRQGGRRGRRLGWRCGWRVDRRCGLPECTKGLNPIATVKTEASKLRMFFSLIAKAKVMEADTKQDGKWARYVFAAVSQLETPWKPAVLSWVSWAGNCLPT